MKYSVNIIADAENDIYEIYKYIAIHDSIDNAEKILSGIEENCDSLGNFPERGHVPPELERIGVKMYREIHYNLFRIVYQVHEKTVYVHCVLDGRRDMMSLLEERLLR